MTRVEVFEPCFLRCYLLNGPVYKYIYIYMYEISM